MPPHTMTVMPAAVRFVLDLYELPHHARTVADEMRVLSRSGMRVSVDPLRETESLGHRPVPGDIAALVRDGTVDFAPSSPHPAGEDLAVVHLRARSERPLVLPPISPARALVVVKGGPGFQRLQTSPVGEQLRSWCPDLTWFRFSPDATADTESGLRSWPMVVDTEHRRAVHHRRHDTPVVLRPGTDLRQGGGLPTPSVLADAFGTDGSWRVALLGGSRWLTDVMGMEIPRTWQRHAGAEDPSRALAGADAAVILREQQTFYYRRLTLEALALGVPVVLPVSERHLYGDAATYTVPHCVRDSVATTLPPGARAELAQRGRSMLEQHHSPRTLVDLVTEHAPSTSRPSSIPEPGVAADKEPIPARAEEWAGPAVPQRPVPDGGAPRVLLMSSNGSGMGHLTRLLAYATTGSSALSCSFLSLSEAFSVATRFGYEADYLPSAQRLAMPGHQWRRMFVARTDELIRATDPQVVVFDGTYPYGGLETLRERNGSVKWIWSRRGMWRPGQGHRNLGRSHLFDAVVEPGDLAAAADRGATRDSDAEGIRPVTLVGPGDLVDRVQARRELGLPAHGRVGLVSLGAGNLNDTRAGIGAAVAALRSAGITPCITRNVLSRSRGASDDSLLSVDRYPLSTHYAAFDVAITASGYNSFHESLRLSLPSVFIPNSQTRLDDQVGRARYAAEQGWAHCCEDPSAGRLSEMVLDLAETGPDRARSGAAADPGNGAQDMVDIILREALS